MSFVGGGSYPWMSPELLDLDDAREHKPTKESDIYALGMLIYEVRIPDFLRCDYGGLKKSNETGFMWDHSFW